MDRYMHGTRASIQPLSMVKRKESTNSGLSIGYNGNSDDDSGDGDEDEDVIAQRISAWRLLPSLNMSKI